MRDFKEVVQRLIESEDMVVKLSIGHGVVVQPTIGIGDPVLKIGDK